MSFPFEVKREEDMQGNPFDRDDGPLSVRHRMKVIGLAEEHFHVGFLISVQSGKTRKTRQL